MTIHPDKRRVEIHAYACLDVGYLEQIACGPGTREHESLVVISAKPSEVHAAMLMAGFEPGAPGRWHWNEDTDELTLMPPRGDAVDIRFLYQRPDGETVIEPVRAWIRSDDGEAAFPDRPWIFAGSAFRDNPEWMGPGEHYVADMTGSIIGLVTFGDEVIGFPEVIADQASVHAPVWVVDSDHVPPIGTPVTVVITPADAGAAAGDSTPASK